MKIVDRLPDFPKRVALRGLQLEAYQALQNIDPNRPVIKVEPDGQHVAAVKRAFAAAAKALHGSVETRNAEDGAVLVKWAASPRASRSAAGGRPKREHSADVIDQEIRRLADQKGAPLESLSADERRKLSISAKRNLSRRANG